MTLPPHPPFEVRPAEPGETVYRVLSDAQPTIEDFLTDEQHDKVENLAASGSMAIYRGISVRKTLPQAKSLARRIGRGYVGELTLTWREGDALARTFATPGHYTLWANPTQLLTRVAVHTVEG